MIYKAIYFASKIKTSSHFNDEVDNNNEQLVNIKYLTRCQLLTWVDKIVAEFDVKLLTILLFGKQLNNCLKYLLKQS